MTEPTEANQYPTPEQNAADAAEAKAVEEMLAEQKRGYWDEAEADYDRLRLGEIDG